MNQVAYSYSEKLQDRKPGLSIWRLTKTTMQHWTYKWRPKVRRLWRDWFTYTEFDE